MQKPQSVLALGLHGSIGQERSCRLRRGWTASAEVRFDELVAKVQQGEERTKG